RGAGADTVLSTGDRQVGMRGDAAVEHRDVGVDGTAVALDIGLRVREEPDAADTGRNHLWRLCRRRWRRRWCGRRVLGLLVLLVPLLVLVFVLMFVLTLRLDSVEGYDLPVGRDDDARNLLQLAPVRRRDLARESVDDLVVLVRGIDVEAAEDLVG